MSTIRTMLLTIFIIILSVAVLFIPISTSSPAIQSQTMTLIPEPEGKRPATVNIPHADELFEEKSVLRTEPVSKRSEKPEDNIQQDLPAYIQALKPEEKSIAEKTITPEPEAETAKSSPKTALESTPKLEPAQETDEITIKDEATIYQNLSSVTKPPVFDAVELSNKIIYPPLAKRQNREGTVVLRLFISTTGNIDKISLEQDPGYRMGQAAMNALSQIQVVPAEITGKPVAVQLLFPVHFRLKH